MMSRSFVLALSVFSLTSSAMDAQAPRAKKASIPQSASIEGDVFLLMQSGDVKKAGGIAIRLLRDTDSLRASHTAACDDYRAKEAYFAEKKRVADSVVTVANETRIIGNHKAFMAGMEAAQVKRNIAAAFADSAKENLNADLNKVLTGFYDANLRVGETGMNAHYKFDDLNAGSYIVYAEWEIGDINNVFWAPITLGAGEHLTRDLNNSVAKIDPPSEKPIHVYCLERF